VRDWKFRLKPHLDLIYQTLMGKVGMTLILGFSNCVECGVYDRSWRWMRELPTTLRLREGLALSLRLSTPKHL